MMHADLIITNIKTLYTPSITPPIRGKDLSKVESVVNASIAIQNERILDFGSHDYKVYIGDKTEIYDAHGRIVIPG
jgi:imidazolonepropionase-like amidohydrolase